MANDRQDIHNSDIPVVCRSCEARHKGVCGALSGEQLTKLNEYTTKHTVSNANNIYRSDEENAPYSNILSGVVKLTKLMADGRQQIVGLQFAPDFVGRLFSTGNNVSAEAATDVKLCSFPRTILEEIMAEAPGMEHRLYQQTLKELDEARDWMLTLGRKTAAEKVASFIYLVASHVDPEADHEDGNISIDLPMKRGDIADFLGLTIETVSRQFTNLRKSGIIDIPDRRTIVVPDMSRLQAASEQYVSR